MVSFLSFLDAHTSLVALFSLLLICFILKRSSKSHQMREAPIAGGSWPIIGHLPMLGGSNVPHHSLGAMADKYGPIFTIKLGSRRALVISNRELAKECYTTHDLALSNRPKLVASDNFSYNQAMLLFTPYGSYWSEIRKLSTLGLLSNRRVQELSHVRVSEVVSSVKALFELWSEKRNESGQILVDMSRCFGGLIMNDILRMMSGKRYFGEEAEVNEEEARRFLKTLREFVRLMGVFVIGDAIPCLRRFDLDGHEKEMKKTAKELDTILNEWMEEHRRKRAAAGDRKVEEDFMDVMLSVLGGPKLGGYDVDTINKATTLVLIAGGVDTTTVTLTWAVSRLLNNPHTLREAQKELDMQVGRERTVKESDISQLEYLKAIVKETLRLHPPVSLGGQREFTEDCIVDGYFVKKGTRLITNLWKLQTDPNIWSDPLEFKPERFLTTHKDVDMRGHHYELLPFGSGRRVCPGISFGLQTIHVTLATFLHSLEFSKPSDEPIDMSEEFGLTTMKATPLEALVRPRLSSHLYGAL